MILRKTAKKFDGINPEALREYHKSHILDTMGIVVVGVDFEDSLDNGGAIKLFFRYQSAKVRQRNIVDNIGVIIKNKEDAHYVDCNVTGSSYGTPKYPNFQLNIFFERCLFTVIDKLVCGDVTFEIFSTVI